MFSAWSWDSVGSMGSAWGMNLEMWKVSADWMRDLRRFCLDVSWFHIWLSISISRVRNRIYARRPYGVLFHQVVFENMSWIAISTFWKTWAVFRPWEINLWMQPATPIAAEIISRCSSGPTAGRMLVRNRSCLLPSDVTHGQQAASEYTFQKAFWLFQASLMVNAGFLLVQDEPMDCQEDLTETCFIK
jgi:hypothetical protein